MERKKNPKFDLEKKRKTFFQIGLILSLLLVLIAFEWRTTEKITVDLGDVAWDADWEEEMENTFREEKVPPPPPPPPPAIEIVENHEAIKNEAKVESTDSGEDLIIDEPGEESVPDEEFTIVEHMPLFEGCSSDDCTNGAIYQYIMKHVSYPPKAKENNVTGKVYLSFLVNKKGEVTDVRVERGVDKYLDAEAVRVVKSLPSFKPGKQRGKPVNVRFNTRISFSLN
jgi:periplasmic protein TonB